MIIGKEGEQPFKIRGHNVSRIHCELTMNDGKLILRDLNSSNGTFIRDKITGEFIPIVEKEIDETTLICLASDNNAGCTFYAYNVFHPFEYGVVIDYLNEIEDRFDQEEEKLEKRIKMEKIVSLLLSLIVMIITTNYVNEKLNLGISPDGRMNMMRIVTMITPLIALFYDSTTVRKKLKERREAFHHCPNPECNKKLKTDDIRSGQHLSCKTIF